MTATEARNNAKQTGPIQFTTLNRWRRERAMLEVFLVNGQRLVGRVRSFDRFSMLLDMPQGGCFVFHHTVSTMQPAGKGRRPAPGGKPPRREGAYDGPPRAAPRERRAPMSDPLAARHEPRRPAAGAAVPEVKVVRRTRRIIQRDDE
ncbi:MAG: RNA chaperone Hfq [Burkholderiaceae bacterium]